MRLTEEEIARAKKMVPGVMTIGDEIGWLIRDFVPRAIADLEELKAENERLLAAMAADSGIERTRE